MSHRERGEIPGGSIDASAIAFAIKDKKTKTLRDDHQRALRFIKKLDRQRKVKRAIDSIFYLFSLIFPTTK